MQGDTVGDFKNIVVVGLGLMGASMALSMRAAGYENVRGWDINPATLEFAIAHEVVGQHDLNLRELLSWADTVVLAVYPDQMIAFLQEHQEELQVGSRVVDISGIKSALIGQVRSFLRTDVDFLSIHQMAGREKSGIEMATAELFEHSNFIIVQQAENRAENIEHLERLAEKMRVQRVCRLSAQEHDEIIAYTSHLPHVVAISLVNSSSFNERTAHFVGGSFRDATRVALINSQLWTQLFLTNKQQVLEEIDKLKVQLDRVSTALQANSQEELQKILVAANSNRSKLCK